MRIFVSETKVPSSEEFAKELAHTVAMQIANDPGDGTRLAHLVETLTIELGKSISVVVSGDEAGIKDVAETVKTNIQRVASIFAPKALVARLAIRAMKETRDAAKARKDKLN